MPPEDEVLPTEEQPLPVAVSPTADSPGYVPESAPEEDPEEDDDKDLEEDLADYLAGGGDDGDDEDESFDDDKDNDGDIEGDEEEEAHPALAESIAVALPVVDHAPSAEETGLFETDESAATLPPHPAYRVARLLAIPTPPPSPLSPWLSPLPQIPSPPLPPILSPLPILSPPPASPTYPLGYRATMIRLRAKASSTSYSPPLHIILSHTRADTPPSWTPLLLPIFLPTSSPPLHLLSTDRRADRPEVTLPPRKRLCIALVPIYEVGKSSSAPTARPPRGFWSNYGEPANDDTELGRRMIKFTTRVRQDTDEIYTRLDDEQTERQLMAGMLNMLYRDRHAHARTATLIEVEARMTADIDYRVAGRRSQETGGDYRDVGSRPQETGTPDALEEAAPKRATRSNTAPETTNTTSVTNAQLQAMIDQGITAALAARDADRNTNGNDSHNSGTGVRRIETTTRECTYTDFLKCQPLNFKGTKGVYGLSQWFERMESIFHISNCTVENQVKFATCTLHSVALTWWNTHVKTVGHDAAYGMPWKILMKMMTDKYCPRNEIKKLEMKIWDLKRVKGSLRTPQGTLRTNNNNNNNNRTRGRTLAGLILQGLVKRNNMGDLNPYAQNTTITMTVHVLPDATSAIKLAIWPVTAGALQPLTMLTIRGALGRVRSLLAISVEFRDILRGNIQS
ncbi:hypothetical protein Tco_1258174 [Tanacetum coccineum]